MENNALLNIASGDQVIVTISGLDDVVQENRGQYFFRNNSHYVIYEEQIEGLKEPLKSKLKIKEGYLELTRKGAADMTILLECGKEHSVMYMTPTGAIDLSFRAKNISVKQMGKQIEVATVYSMGQGDWKQENCRLNIKIKRIS